MSNVTIEMMMKAVADYPEATPTALGVAAANLDDNINSLPDDTTPLEYYMVSLSEAVIEYQPRITQHDALFDQDIQLTKAEYVERWTQTVSDLPFILSLKRTSAIEKEIANAAAENFTVIYAAQQEKAAAAA